MASEAVEREYKFDVGPDFDPPDLRPIVGRTVRHPEQALSTAYFDTDDGRLRAAGASLRHRQQGSEPAPEGEWTLKLPVTAPSADERMSERTEYNWPGRRDALPAAALAVVAGLVRRSDLAVVAELRATRRRLALQRPDAEQPWAEIDDDVVDIVVGPAAGQRFRQLEVELSPDGSPPPGEVEAVLDALSRAGASPSTASKLSMALGPAPSRPSAPGANPTVADSFAASLRAALDRLTRHDLRLRLHGPTAAGPDPHDVHKARVAMRTIRSNLLTFDSVLDPVWSAHVVADLRWAAAALGAVRDLDVLLERVEAARDGNDRVGVAELARVVAAERRAAAEAAGAVLAEPRYVDLLDRLHAASRQPPVMDRGNGVRPGAPARKAMGGLVAARYRAVTKRLAGPRSAEDLHRIRIRAKRLRYAAEAAAPVVGKPAWRTADAARNLQNHLGEARDATRAAGLLRDLAVRPGTPPAAAFAAGRLTLRAETDASQREAGWRKPARKLAAGKARSWLS